MTTITVRRDTAARCWTATIVGGELETRTRELFNTNVLPLPYTHRADCQTVYENTQRQYADDPTISVQIPLTEMIG